MFEDTVPPAIYPEIFGIFTEDLIKILCISGNEPEILY